MSTRWTEAQERAIKARGKHLLVAAGAGAGKTAVLVERIIRRLTDAATPIDVGELLVVTFTNAAAREMRERIAQALTEAAMASPGDHRLNRQLALLDHAAIFTLHSFCLDLLRQYFYRLDLDPAFRVTDATEAELLQLDVLDKYFEEQYEQADDTWLDLVDAYGGSHDDDELRQMVLRLAERAASHPDPEAWLSALPEKPNDPKQRESWYRLLRQAVENDLRAALQSLRQALVISKQPEGPEQYADCLTHEKEQIDSLLKNMASLSWDEMRNRVLDIEFNRLPGKKGGSDELKEQAKRARDAAKDKINGLAKKTLAQSEADLAQGLAQAAPFLELLSGLVKDFRIRYGLAKAEKGLLDFNDLEHHALRLLQEGGQLSPIALELRQRFREILVDEYQDINGVQEAILQAISDPAGEDNQLFMVGDVKQSIYRFRLADPTLFLKKYHAYSFGEAPGERIDLSHNFRSRENVLQAVNFVFRQLMTETVGELAYDEAAELKAGAGYAPEDRALTPDVDIILLDRSAEREEDDLGEELDAAGREAQAIARSVAKLVKAGGHVVWDKGKKSYRPLAYRDIVILLRATQGRANIYLEQLHNLDIPAYAELGTGYFEATEIRVMLSLLKIIDNPRQDIPLAAVLRSPLVGLEGEDLAEIRLALPEGSFYDALAVAATKEDTRGAKLREFLAQLEKWREQARRARLPDLIWQIYSDTGYLRLAGAMPGGGQRQANLRALHDRAQQYEATSYRGLFRFLRFIERLQADDNDLGTAPALSENDDVVRIMSIHKSKGLEFPVVYVGGLGNLFNRRDLRQNLLIHQDLGLGPMAIDLERHVRYPTLPRLAIEQQLLSETLSEELRVLYVAFTRAREKLCLVGSLRDLPRAIERWRETARLPRDAQGALPLFVLLGANNYLDWLGPALMGHPQVAAALAPEGEDAPAGKSLPRDPSLWHLETSFSAPATEEGKSQKEELEALRQNRALSDRGWREVVRGPLDYIYPHGELKGKHLKVSVSELKHRFELTDEETAPIRWQKPPKVRPRFVQESGGPSGAELGSGLHLMLQHIDFNKDPSLETLEALKLRMLGTDLLSSEVAGRLDMQLLYAFLQSPLGFRLRQAGQVWRELPFSLRLPAGNLYKAASDGEHVFVQGIIDCVVREGEEALIIDFKSDRVTEANVSQVAAEYQIQVDFYTRAVEALLKLPVKERYLYFLRLGRAYKL